MMGGILGGQAVRFLIGGTASAIAKSAAGRAMVTALGVGKAGMAHGMGRAAGHGMARGIGCGMGRAAGHGAAGGKGHGKSSGDSLVKDAGKLVRDLSKQADSASKKRSDQAGQPLPSVYRKQILLILLKKPDGLRQETLKDTLKIDAAYLSSIVNGLEAEGYIIRKIDPDNEDSALLFLTKKGMGRARDLRKRR